MFLSAWSKMFSYRRTIYLSIATFSTIVAAGFLFSANTYACCGTPPPPPFNGYGGDRAVDIESLSLGERCTVYQPRTGTQNLPVVIWSGMTGTTTQNYSDGLEHIASYHYVVGSVDSTGSSDGEAMLACLDLISANENVRADTTKVAMAGHSIGGSSALAAGTDPRVDTTLAIQPYLNTASGHESAWHSQQQGALLLLVGDDDMVVDLDLVEALFYEANVPVFSAMDYFANHFEPLDDFGNFKPVITGWLNYRLKNDSRAAELFVLPKRLVCADPDWGCEIEGVFE